MPTIRSLEEVILATLETGIKEGNWVIIQVLQYCTTDRISYPIEMDSYYYC